MTEYDYATDIAVKQEEAYAIGLERGIERGRQEGVERGAYEKALETAQLMIGLGIPLEQVQLCTTLPLDVVQGLIQDQ
jgi:predicted transposase YdaD